MAISKTFIIVLSLFMALVLFTKHVDQCCDAFTDVSTSIADLQIDDEDHMDADEPAVLPILLVSFHSILPNISSNALVRYNQPDLPTALKPPRV